MTRIDHYEFGRIVIDGREELQDRGLTVEALPPARPDRSVASRSSARSGRGGRLGGLRWLIELLDAGGELEVAVG
jgi:hypothetical protein